MLPLFMSLQNSKIHGKLEINNESGYSMEVIFKFHEISSCNPFHWWVKPEKV